MAAKQMEIPGAEAPRIKEIDEAAESYVSIRDKRNKMTEKVLEARKGLVDVLKLNVKELSLRPNGVRVYRFDDMVVELRPRTDSVAVKPYKEKPRTEDDENEND